ncbi:glycoside hydrolase family 97 protein [Nitrospirillum amazonense]|uniref:glycoside hydrolase family 97 protein n=1 Tax=Nitrospirillum amazonense TaxID=28077 RepID=UPI002DD44305|nr:glycoside hydrolase family 97 protein [Nitrospirillum amazonense]MEC4594244.1 glycoside hydrolase family 97 protein [Nitrospirillum amazonense]
MVSLTRRLGALVVLAVVLVALPALAETPAKIVATIASPAGTLAVRVELDGEGRPAYAVTRRGAEVIAPSRLGFLFTDAPKMERGFALAGQSSRTVDETWEQPWGEWRTIANHFNELRVRLKEKAGAARELDVVFRVYDDGVGFRYEFPDQPQLKTVRIADELTEFAVVRTGEAWWTPAGEWDSYEYIYNHTPLAELGQTHTPLTIRTDDGTHIALHEAALVDYAGMWVRRVDGQRLKATLSPSPLGARVVRQAPFTTPWRTLIFADSAGGLYQSHLELNLNEPNALGDVSWVKPEKFVGVWWEMHLGSASWATGRKHGATTANVRKHIDFAAANGIGGVLVEGWNVGWDGQWFGNGNDFDFKKPTPDLDWAGMAAYARSKGVNLIGHHETGGSVSHYESQLGAALDYAQGLGIPAIKTGYVTDDGDIERVEPDGTTLREWHDGQWMSRHYLRVVTEAAKRHIAIDSHEPIKDTGLRRTYPNWVAREGARGMEYNAWGDPKNPPNHEATLAFTRMLSGPFDFTPGVVSLTGKDNTRIPSTLAKQLALYVVLYSPVQMLADLPENYAKYPDALAFIKAVPVDWSDTRVLNGEVGQYATFARKDRKGDDWYLGSVGDDQPRTLTVTLDFLDAGRDYTAHIYRDGPNADWHTDGHPMIVETRTVHQGDTLSLPLARGGGAAVQLVAGKGH